MKQCPFCKAELEDEARFWCRVGCQDGEGRYFKDIAQEVYGATWAEMTL